jgi:antirestriction protein ArdC
MKADRCNRKTENEGAFFGNENYSREELVAEMGSAMLCSRCGIENPKTFQNSVAYLQSWIKALKNDIKMIIWASSRAEKAAEFIWGEN